MDAFFVFLIVLASLGCTTAETPADLRKQLQSAVNSCDIKNVDPKTLATIKSSEVLRNRNIMTPEATCLLECLVRKAGLVANGKIDVPKASKVVQALGKNENHVKIAVEALKKCDKHTLATKPRCPVGELIKECEHKFANDLTMLGFILRGE